MDCQEHSEWNGGSQCPFCEVVRLREDRARLAAENRALRENGKWKLVADALEWAIDPHTHRHDVVERIDRCHDYYLKTYPAATDEEE